MIMLQGSREDSSRYYNSDFVLDQRRVNIGYSQYKRAGYLKNFKADLYEDWFYLLFYFILKYID